ncbi:MAG: hypothetical protein ACRDD2_07340 [Sarcina sp.]
MDIKLELEREKLKYGNIYSDIMFSLNEIEDFEENTTLKNRFYYRASRLLKEYLAMMDDINFEINKKVGFFEKMKQKSLIDSKYNELMNFKNRNIKDLNKLCNCTKCKCLKCISDCNLDPCNRCKDAGAVNFCEDGNNLIKFTNLVESQYNYQTSQYENIDILAEVIVNEKRYRFIYDRGERRNLIFNFNYSLNEGNLYEPVPDDDEDLNKVIEIFESNKY